jgi:hypothetical protein
MTSANNDASQSCGQVESKDQPGRSGGPSKGRGVEGRFSLSTLDSAPADCNSPLSAGQEATKHPSSVSHKENEEGHTGSDSTTTLGLVQNWQCQTACPAGEGPRDEPEWREGKHENVRSPVAAPLS